MSSPMPRPGPGGLASMTRVVAAAASGDYTSVPIEVTASKIVRCSKQTRAYSVLRYKFPRGSPFLGVPADATGGGYFGQDQPLPPANQTVSLTC